MDIKQWYLPDDKQTRDALHWELFKYCRSRSIALMGEEKKDRFLNLGQIGEFKKELTAKFDHENPYWTFYASVEHLAKTSQLTRQEFKEQIDQGKSLQDIKKDQGTFIEAVKNRKEELENNTLESTVYFPANYKDHWYDFIYDAPGYDLVFDIDGDEVLAERHDLTKDEVDDKYNKREIVKAAQEEAAKIVEYMQKKKAPFYIKFSGGRGFHIGLPRDKIKDYSATARQFATFITETTGAKVDLTIYKDRQLYRVPYTMHCDSHLICMPLTNDQFWNFELKYASPDYIRNNISLRDRGLCTRSGKANRIIKDFREWKEQNDIISPDTNNRSSRGTSRIDKVISQYKALSKEEKKQFMEKVQK